MQPKFTRPIDANNPFGNRIPKNYFCEYKFELDWYKVYKLNIVRLYSIDNYVMENINMNLRGIT